MAKVLKYWSGMDDAEFKKFYAALPSRKNFVDTAENLRLQRDIAAGANIYFMPTNTIEAHIKEGGNNGTTQVYRLILTGCLQDGSGAAVILENVDVFLDAKVPDDADLEEFREAMGNRFREERIFCTHIEHVRMRPFMYYQKGESDYFRIYFNTLHNRNRAQKFLTGGQFEYVNRSEKLITKVIETASNDGVYSSSDSKQGTVYYRKAAREYRFTLGDWNCLSNYRMDDGDFISRQKRQYVIRVSVEDFVPIVSLGIDKQKVQSLKYDKTLVACRDYETYSNKPTGNAPVPEHVLDDNGDELDVIFMSGMTFHWHYDKNPLIAVNITTLPTIGRSDCLTIQVVDQIDIIKVETYVLAKMSPDILTGFNDGMYDTPMMARRAETYDAKFGTNIVETIRRNTSCVRFTDETDKYLIGGFGMEKNIKIEADQYVTNEIINNNGLLPIDTRTIFRKLHPKDKDSNLNYYLQKYKLPSKEEMPYATMFRIYNTACRFIELLDTRDYTKIINYLEKVAATHGQDFKPLSREGLAKLGLSYKPKGTRMENDRPWYSHIDCGNNTAVDYTVTEIIALMGEITNVINYCNVDSARCIELLIAANVISDKRELSILSFTSQYDCFYRADGMRVRNLVISEGIRPEWNIAFDVAKKGEKSDKKYPGAFVVPPHKNLSRDHVLVKRARRMINAAGENSPIRLEQVDPKSKEFDATLLNPEDPRWNIANFMKVSNDEDEEIDRPCTGLDFSSLYPSLVMAYNLSPEKCIRPGTDVEAVFAELQKAHPGLTRKQLMHHCEFKYGFDGQDEEDKDHIVGDFIRHLPAEGGKYIGMGLYPHILLMLFNKRSVVKKLMDYYDCPKEFIEKFMDLFKGGSAAPTKPKLLEYLSEIKSQRDKVVEEVLGTQKENYYRHQVDEVTRAIAFVEKEWTDDISLADLYKTIVFYKSYYNIKQLAIKVFMNTFYGETGNALSPFFIVQVAGSITTSGKDNIHMVKDFVESCNYKVKYGDSVPADEPILVRDSRGIISYRTIDSIGTDWSDFDEAEGRLGCGKEHAPTPFEVWSDSGWTKIRRVIRHHTNKNIYRVSTSGGCVDVTEDHSLLDPKANVLTPLQCEVGTELLHSALPVDKLYNSPIVDTNSKIGRAIMYYNSGRVSTDYSIKNIVNLGAKLQMVYDLETDSGHFCAGIGSIVVHNTDSLYIVCPESCFTEVDRLYVTGEITKLEYWTAMIEITMETIDKFKDEVNALLNRDNGTKFLKMAYEEVLFPYVMLGKKKYMGIKHEGIVNLSAVMPEITIEQFMKSRTLFVRGIDFIKRGASQFLKQITFGPIRDMFNIATTDSMLQLFERKLGDITQYNYDPKLFVKTATYKLPGKNDFGEDKQGNVSVLTFVKRMQYIEKNHPELGMKPPTLGERFEYIIARRNPYRYDLRGRKYELSAGEKYEDFRYFNHAGYHKLLGGPIEIDRDYYITNEVIGQFARFVLYHPKYDKWADINTDLEGRKDTSSILTYKEIDKKAVDYAKRELTKYFKANFGFTYENRGKDYKDIYKNTYKKIEIGLENKYGGGAFLIGIANKITTDTNEVGEYNLTHTQIKKLIIDKIIDKARKKSKCGLLAQTRKQIKSLTTELGLTPEYLYSYYVSGRNSAKNLMKQKNTMAQQAIEKLISENCNNYIDYCFQNAAIIARIITSTSREEFITPNVPYDPKEYEYFMGIFSSETIPLQNDSEEEEMDPIKKELYFIHLQYLKLFSLFRMQHEIDELQKQLTALKDKAAGNTAPPPLKKAEQKSIADALTAWLTTKPISIEETKTFSL